jgi:hypothetical protein
LRDFFKEFTRRYATDIAPEIIKPHDDLDDYTYEYTEGGFPGALFSMDCTHVRYLQCPNQLSIPCTNGKTKVPTIVYEVMVNHRREAVFVSPSGFFGTVNDQVLIPTHTRTHTHTHNTHTTHTQHTRSFIYL